MNSRINIGDGFSIPQDNQFQDFQFMGSWIPATPEKPKSTISNPIPIDRHVSQVGRLNHQEPNRFPTCSKNGAAQDLNPIEQLTNRNGDHHHNTNAGLAGRKGLINLIAGSYKQAWNSNQMENLLGRNYTNAASTVVPVNKSIAVDNSLMQNVHSDVRNWGEFDLDDLLFTDNISCSFSSLLNSDVYSLNHMSQNGLPASQRPLYDLNSPPTVEANGSSTATSSLHSVPLTQNWVIRTDNTQLPEALNSSTRDNLVQEKEHPENRVIATGNETLEQNIDELLQNILDSSVVNSTGPKELKDGTGENDKGIDLNKTPQQKAPKRKKYMPKVVKESKAKQKTPKTATTTNGKHKKKTGGKRKQVCKTNAKEAETQESDGIREMGGSTHEIPTKTCRRSLNFDLEKTRDGREVVVEKQQRAFNLNLVSEIRVDVNRANPSCKDAVAQVGQLNRLPVRSPQLDTPIGNQQNQQPGLLIGNRYDKQTGLTIKNLQSGLPKGNQRPGLLRGNQQPRIPTGNQQLGLPTGNQQPKLAIGNLKNQQNGLPTGNWQSGTTVGNQQIWQTGLPIASQQNQQPGLLIGNWQSGIPIQNPHPEFPIGNQLAGTVGSYISHLSQMIAGNTSLPGKQAAETSHVPGVDLHVEILRNLSRSTSATTCQTGSKTECSSFQQNIHGGNAYVPFTDGSNGEALNMARTLMSQNISHSAPTSLSKCSETRGSKREYHHANGQIHNCATDTSIHSSLLQQLSQMQEFERDRRHMDAAFSEAHKKMKIQNGISTYMRSKHCEVVEIKDGPDDTLPKGSKNADANGLASKRNSFPVQNAANNEKCVLVRPPPPRKASVMENQLVVYHAPASEIEAIEPTQSKSASFRKKMKEKQDKALNKSGKARGPSAELVYPDSVDEIMHRLQNLNLGDKTLQMKQNALVLYQGDGAVVPYEIKKRKPRPKVDLDDETNRIWNLLMGKGGSEDYQEMDKEKEKWWKEERRVFRGRADSFIARMHLVQGDRRFSPWKGSVVDSVIGVFLTQNVTDHLSSSAFMSLAARFPPKSNCNRADDRNTTSTIVEEPEACILNLNDFPAWQETVVHHSPSMQVFVIDSELKEQTKYSSNSRIERIGFVETSTQNLEEEVLSSQDSFDPSVFHPSGGIGSCSGSNSDAEFSTTRWEPKAAHGSTNFPTIGNTTTLDEIYGQGNKSPQAHEGSNNGHVEETTRNAPHKPRTDGINNCKDSTSFSQQTNHYNVQMEMLPNRSSSSHQQSISQPQLWDIENFGMHNKGNMYSWLSIASGVSKENQARVLQNRVRQPGNMVCKSTGQNETPRPTAYAFSSKHQMYQESNSVQGSHLQDNQPCNALNNEMNKLLQSRSTFTELLNSAEECATRQSSHSSTILNIPDAPELKQRITGGEQRKTINKNISLENKLVESNSSNQDHSMVENESSSSMFRTTKKKYDDEKKTVTDWDNLRKKVKANGTEKERSKDWVDSIDYKALRRAKVSEISEAIKERGMNNMLAERIKEFLDRLVRDHGSMDLEWLRNVPPDKAKEYLLSIRGLGLKSVECVRLLTLHNLAFPVDTNVGRIAVRLGWVPLQPLPESLQLHLLELYPVLESIQKYLWPRLCKLDQRTLYELHYQLITFGKVFCTKSKPNCNACPMRGECRHFASAFASARLALPGPEEKSLTSASIPMAPNTTPTRIIPPMQLPPPVQNLLREGTNLGKCVPIIEEPATPEPECTEATESDIEDAYYEDPDKIPTIKLNLEEFSANLQRYMEKNMELQEGDMSKALVALDPTAASIPTQKLKNVSRLRTEHQVYELSDSHPLLEGMDKREPDDPSPYLLAIWTPGETANSTQPPDRKCESQNSGRLCDDETCFACNSVREANSQTVRGTLLIPCRTAMRGSFPLNGTYFQVNEVFADHESSLNPVDVPRDWIWNLPRRTVYFGTSVTSIFRGLTTEQIQYCFWRGFVCVRGFEQKTRAPRPLMARLHFPASRLKTKNASPNSESKK